MVWINYGNSENYSKEYDNYCKEGEEITNKWTKKMMPDVCILMVIF